MDHLQGVNSRKWLVGDNELFGAVSPPLGFRLTFVSRRVEGF